MNTPEKRHFELPFISHLPIIEQQYVITSVVVLVSIAVVMASMLSHFFAIKGGPPLVLILFFVGCLGGTSNHYRRLEGLPITDKELKSIVSPVSIFFQSLASPGLGGVFAVIAYLVFGAGILKGPLFPHFKGADFEYWSELSGFFSLVPSENRDVALMFVWAFIAGFSERFIPNLLDKMANDSHPEVNHTTAHAQRPVKTETDIDLKHQG